MDFFSQNSCILSFSGFGELRFGEMKFGELGFCDLVFGKL